MDSLDNMKHMLKLMENAGELHHGDPADFTDLDLAQLISDTVTAGELDLDFDNLSSVADELNATVHWDRMDFADDIADAEFTAGQIEAVLPQVSDLLADQLADIDADAAPGDHDRIAAALEQIQQYPGVTEDMLIPREYQFAEDELEEADLNNGYGQHHSVDGEDLFPNGADGPIQRKVPGRSDNRLGRDKAVPVTESPWSPGVPVGHSSLEVVGYYPVGGEPNTVLDVGELNDKSPLEKIIHAYIDATEVVSTAEYGSWSYDAADSDLQYLSSLLEKKGISWKEVEKLAQEVSETGKYPKIKNDAISESSRDQAVPTESLEESFQRLQKIYDNYTKRSARK